MGESTRRRNGGWSLDGLRRWNARQSWSGRREWFRLGASGRPHRLWWDSVLKRIDQGGDLGASADCSFGLLESAVRSPNGAGSQKWGLVPRLPGGFGGFLYHPPSGRLAQRLAHFLHTEGVIGSIPISPTFGGVSRCLVMIPSSSIRRVENGWRPSGLDGDSHGHRRFGLQ